MVVSCRNLRRGVISATDNSSLTFVDQISAVETGSMMSDVGINICQLRLLRILRNKLGAKIFEPEKWWNVLAVTW